MKILEKLTFPGDIKKHLYLLLPLIASQFFQRLFHIVDNRFVNILGSEALVIHNVQYNFILLGQFIGMATATSALVFWKRTETKEKQGSVLLNHLYLSGGLSLAFAMAFFLFRGHLAVHFGISEQFISLAKMYFVIGLINMILQSIYGGIDGMLVASGKTKYCMFFSGFLVLSNIILDYAAVHFLYKTGGDFQSALFAIGMATSIIATAVIILGFMVVRKQADGWKKFPIVQMLSVWWSEIGMALVRSFVPLIYAYQLALLHATRGFIVSYQMTLHLAYLFCLPLGAGLQIAVRDASAEASESSHKSEWFGVFLYTAMLPTFILLLVGAIIPSQLVDLFYGYQIPSDHMIFIPIFFYACMIGQLGHAFSIPLRARKKNYMIARNFMIAEAGVLVGVTQMLIWAGMADPSTICWATIAFTSTYLALNIYGVRRVWKKERHLLLQVNE